MGSEQREGEGQQEPFSELIASWNAATPAGTWIETLARLRVGGVGLLGIRWTRWYSLGVWSSEEDRMRRHSVNGQDDADARVATDVLKLRTGQAASLQLKVLLHRTDGTAEDTPVVRALFATTSGPLPVAPLAATSHPVTVGQRLDLPQCSQMIYPDGGTVWCSPTCVSMVVAYWTQDQRPCEPRVRAAVAGVYDRVYDGHGNWPFNTAYAATHGLEAYVLRLPHLAEAERWIAAGVPLVLSYGWREGELAGAPIPRSSGHLVILAGFDANGDPIIHDPAAPTNATVRRTYRRAQIERLWRTHSSGTAYAIHPLDWPTPDTSRL